MRLARDVRRVDELVAAAQVLLLPELLDQVAHHAAACGCQSTSPGPTSSWIENRSSSRPSRRWSRLSASSTRFRCSSSSCWVGEGGAVDALQHLVALVAEPVGAGDVRELEGLDLPGAGQVRAAAQVEERAVAVVGDAGRPRGPGRGSAACTSRPPPRSAAAPRRAWSRCSSNGRSSATISRMRASIFSRSSGVNGRGPREVVVEAVLDRRAAGHLRLGEQLASPRWPARARRSGAGGREPRRRGRRRRRGDLRGLGRWTWRAPRAGTGIRGPGAAKGRLPGPHRTGVRSGSRRWRWWAILDLNQ